MRVSGYDFDRVIERRGTGSLKWDSREKQSGRTGLLPLWVADMDFEAPAAVVEAMERRLAHHVFGYTCEPESWFDAAVEWLDRRHGWRVPRPWLLSAPGVVPSLVLAINAFSQPGDRIVIQPPVYHPFPACVLANGRQVAENPLRISAGRVEMDFEQLERVVDGRTRMLILCSPHNPVGRVWRREELARLVDTCSRRGVIIISDEIHHDLVMPGNTHVPTAALSAAASGLTVTLFAPTKTFNMAGLAGSFACIENEDLRRRFQAAKQNAALGMPNPLSLAAQEAAYRHCGPWLDELLGYIRGNYDLLVSFFAARVPRVTVYPLEGTYLAWLDMRGLGLEDGELKERLVSKAGVWLDEGTKFGRGGEGFQRLNLACPRSLLQEALERIAGALG